MITKQINLETGICFFKTLEPVDLKEFLLRADFTPLTICADSALVDEWLDYGCVYVNGRRQRESLRLDCEHVVRLHTRRKRYVTVQSLDDRIVEDNAEFLVVDKPAGLPTHPTLDNYHDNAVQILQRALRIPLFTTHRLDVPTQGLLIVAKTVAAQKLLNKLFSERRVEKFYRSLNESPLAPGSYVHSMDPESRVPKVVKRESVAGWWTCSLDILRTWPHAGFHAHEIQLLTGKTHQIRAQMSALNAPVVGDVTYGARAVAAVDTPMALECLRMNFRFRALDFQLIRQDKFNLLSCFN